MIVVFKFKSFFWFLCDNATSGNYILTVFDNFLYIICIAKRKGNNRTLFALVYNLQEVRKKVVTVQDGSLNITQLAPIQIKTFPFHLHFHFLSVNPSLDHSFNICVPLLSLKLTVHPLLQPTTVWLPP